MSIPLRWNNLKRNACPQCGKTFEVQHFDEDKKMIIHSCKFKISYRRMNQIVVGKIRAEIGEDKQKGIFL